jgi:hypothetical protein
MTFWQEALVAWTIRLALLFYFAVVFLKLHAKQGPSGLCRWIWTAGGLLLAVHIALAMAWAHGWNYDAVYQATAEDTAKVTGTYWGGGVWLNFAMLGMWLADIVWWWCAPAGYNARARYFDWAVQGFFVFMIFNATVVFETGAVRYTSAVLFGALLWFFWRNRK